MVSNMKIASLVVGALAAVAGAQDLSGFPQCAQWCINSMQQANKSQELGCPANDAACACRNPNFLYGVRDCSAELCGSFETAGMAVGYANEYCRNHGVDLQTVTTGLPSQITNTNLPSGARTGTGTGAGATQPAVTTSPILSTATENGTTVVSTVGSTTISGGGGAGTAGSSVTSTVPIVSTVTSGTSTFPTTVGSSTLTTQTTGTGGTTGGANGGTTGGSGGATTTNPNYAPQMTVAPAGLLAAAGVAAFLL